MHSNRRQFGDALTWEWKHKLQYWCAFPAIFGPKGPPMLAFCSIYAIAASSVSNCDRAFAYRTVSPTIMIAGLPMR